MAKKKIDSISKGSATQGETTPVVETIQPHAAPAAEVPAAAVTPAAATESSSEKAADATPAQAPDAATEQPKEASQEAPATEGGENAPAPDSFEALFPEPAVAISAPPSWIWWLILLVISLILAGAGYAMARDKIGNWLSVATPVPTLMASESPSPSASAAATPTPTAETSPTPTPSASATPKGTATVRVLNGTTKAGVASTVRTTLTSKGFTVSGIGNAKSQTYASTMVYYAKGQEAAAASVKAALPSYSITLEESALAAPDDVLVVIGAK